MAIYTKDKFHSANSVYLAKYVDGFLLHVSERIWSNLTVFAQPIYQYFHRYWENRVIAQCQGGNVEQGSLEGFDNCLWPSQIGSKSTEFSIFKLLWAWYMTDDPEKQQRTSAIFLKSMCAMWRPSMNLNYSCSPETLNSDHNRRFFWQVWPWNLMDDLEKNTKTPLPCPWKLCTLFHSRLWSPTGVTVQKRSLG